MTAFNFPGSPALNQIYSLNGVNYQWNGVAWVGGATFAQQQPTEQFFDLATKQYIDIPVPTWARGVNIVGNIFVPGATNYAGLQISLDGTTFKSGATDYTTSGPYHDAMQTPYFGTQGTFTAPTMYLSYPANNLNVPHNFQCDLNLSVASGLISARGWFQAFDNAKGARNQWFENYYNTAGAAAVKAFRVLLNPAGAMGAGSWMRVRWLGDIATIPIGAAVPDAVADGTPYSRQNNLWVKAPPKPVNTAGALGEFRTISTATGAALVLPAGGTWAYAAISINASSGAVPTGFQTGIGAGGAQVIVGNAGCVWSGFAWRIA